MNKEDFVENYVSALGLFIIEPNYPDGKIIKSLIGSIYDHQQTIESLETRITKLERLVCENKVTDIVIIDANVAYEMTENPAKPNEALLNILKND